MYVRKDPRELAVAWLYIIVHPHHRRYYYEQIRAVVPGFASPRVQYTARGNEYFGDHAERPVTYPVVG